MRVAVLSVSRRGYALSKKLKERYPEASVYTSGPWREPWAESISPDLKTLTGALFAKMDALIFIMASGIAVRMIAPYLQRKDTDPAVLVMDDQGQWIIPLLSGHLGGANALAHELARCMGAQAVVTTATDGQGLTAVDMLAVERSWTITSLEAAKRATASLLEGETLAVSSWRPLASPLPAGYRSIGQDAAWTQGWHINVTPFCHEPGDNEVWLIPQCITLGMGCRRDAAFQSVASLVNQAIGELGLDHRAIARIATIDIKAAEPALVKLSEDLHVPLVTYSAGELSAVASQFTQSSFVQKTIGVGAVSEPAGFLASGGRCLLEKRAENGVTLSIWEDC